MIKFFLCVFTTSLICISLCVTVEGSTAVCATPREIPQQCKNYCPPTCANPDPIDCPSFRCERNTCQCGPGYIRVENDGECIIKANCPTEGSTAVCATPREIPQQCKNYCPPTCANPDPIDCPSARCERNTCQCGPGYIRVENDGECIIKANCPNK